MSIPELPFKEHLSFYIEPWVVVNKDHYLYNEDLFIKDSNKHCLIELKPGVLQLEEDIIIYWRPVNLSCDLGLEPPLPLKKAILKKGKYFLFKDKNVQGLFIVRVNSSFLVKPNYSKEVYVTIDNSYSIKFNTEELMLYEGIKNND